MINRHYSPLLPRLIKPGRVLVIYGPRQVGKTTLVTQLLDSYPGQIYRGYGENSQLRRLLESADFSQIIPFFQSYNLAFIDEAQKIRQIGQGLKILVDQLPHLKIIATGSSSFALSHQIGEPLVGRQKILTLFPLSLSELSRHFGSAYPTENLENLLIYGSYPRVITANSLAEKIDLLTDLKDSYLYKDILELERLRHSRQIEDLLRLLAYQIGHQVSLQELGAQLGLNRNTVARYLDLLEKAFVIINIRGFSRNLRKEISKTSRYYFYDNGVRNAIINNLNPLSTRNDIGQLWENFLFIERLKKQTYTNMTVTNYFWRTWDQKEIDLIEERNGRLYGYEFKWNPAKKVSPPKDWLTTYPNAHYQVITRHNYLKFIS